MLPRNSTAQSVGFKRIRAAMSLHWRGLRELFVRECHVLSSRYDRGLGRIVCHRHGVGRIGRLRRLWVGWARSLRLCASAALRFRRLRRLRLACGDLCAARLCASGVCAGAAADCSGADRRRSLGYRRLGRLRRGGCGGIGCGCGSCGCGRGLLYGLAAAPAPIYVVNQGPEYSGPGIMVPYHTYSPQAGFVAPYDYPYISGRGYGYGHRYGYGCATAMRIRIIAHRPRFAYGERGYVHPHRLRPDGVWPPLWVSASPGRHAELLRQTISRVCEGPPGAGLRFFSSPKSVRRRGSRCKAPAPRRSTR